MLRSAWPNLPNFKLLPFFDISHTEDHSQFIGPVVVMEDPVWDLPQARKRSACAWTLMVDRTPLSTLMLAMRVIRFAKFDHGKRSAAGCAVATRALLVFMQHVRAVVFIDRFDFHGSHLNSRSYSLTDSNMPGEPIWAVARIIPSMRDGPSYWVAQCKCTVYFDESRIPHRRRPKNGLLERYAY